MTGLFNEASFTNDVPEQFSDVLRYIDRWGDPTTYAHYAAGWAVAGDTPFSWTKQVASSYGGTRNSMEIHYRDQRDRAPLSRRSYGGRGQAERN